MSDLAPNLEPVVTGAQWIADGKAAKQDFDAARIDDSTLLLEQRGGISEIIRFDESGDGFAVERVQDVESVLEWCKGRYNQGLVNRHCEFRQVASIPTVVAEIYARANLGPQAQWSDLIRKENSGLFKRMLNDPDLALFRSMPGTV